VNESVRERLYNLLPSIYKIRDIERGDEALRALMAVIQSEFDRLEADIGGLYNDWFIETCAEWVVPYIGDLLGVCNLQSVESAGIFSQRAYVANTLRYRRRKGTVPVLEQLARDVTGWPARAVELFERLITTQHVNHVRLHSAVTVDLRNAGQLELLDGPFEHAAHTAEVRRIATGRGKYNIPNLGLFLWRLQPYFVTRSTPRPVSDPDDGRYRFSPLGNDIRLFNRPRTETEITHLAEEVDVPGTLRRRALHDDLEALRQTLADDQPEMESLFLSTENPAFQVFVEDADGELAPFPPEEILICDLSDVSDLPDWRRPPVTKTYTSRTRLDDSVDPPIPLEVELPIRVALDPETGRLAFPEGTVAERVAVSYAYGFSSDIGGGPYGRRQSVTVPASLETWSRTVSQNDPTAGRSKLADALADWTTDGSDEAIITIADSGTYAEDISIDLSGGRSLVIQAADGELPTLRLFNGPDDLGELVMTGGNGSEAVLTLNGLWIEGGIRIAANSLGKLVLDHCTLVPGRGLDAESQPLRPELPSLIVELPNAGLEIEIRNSIVGPLRLPEEITRLTVLDSIIHSALMGDPGLRAPAIAMDDSGVEPGPPTSLERVTVFGPIHVRELILASECVFTERAVAQRRQAGCTRFCFVPEGSRVPRRFRCQPDLALEAYAQGLGKFSVSDLTKPQRKAVAARLTPTFTSVLYGDPGYAQLSRTCAEEIRTGAADGAEMGVFSALKQPLREANLRASLEEYLRFGLEAGIFYVT
jgi:hypothetical protein